MGQVVRAKEDGWLVRLHVEPDCLVGLGDSLYDFQPISGGGVEYTVRALDSGCIYMFKDDSPFLAANDDMRAIRVRKGQALLAVLPKKIKPDAGKIIGCTPRPTTVVSKRRARGLNLQ